MAWRRHDPRCDRYCGLGDRKDPEALSDMVETRPFSETLMAVELNLSLVIRAVSQGRVGATEEQARAQAPW